MNTHANTGIFKVITFLLALCLMNSLSAKSSERISLSGTWDFALDRKDAGIKQKWFSKELKEEIRLPGILQNQGYGNDISEDTPWVISLYDRYWYEREKFRQFARGDVKVPFLAQPRKHYLGPAWYQKMITIPESWDGKRGELVLERTRWQTTVWLGSEKIGSQDSLVAPHRFELGMLKPGSYKLTIRIDNRMKMDYRPDAHSVSDSLGTTWNGIAGDIAITSTPPVWIDHIAAMPDINNKSVKLKIDIENITGASGQGVVKIKGYGISEPVSWSAESGRAEIDVPLGENAELWSEFNPQLYDIKAVLEGQSFSHSYTVNFGLREIKAGEDNLLLNGRKAHFRGTHSGGDFPLTGCAATDVEYWENLFAKCKKWGLNHMRFHSFCPPEAAFTAADRAGFYLQPECGMWNVINPDSEMEKRMYEETERMLREYGNHPSFVLFSPSNEPKGHWKESLPEWTAHYGKKDPRRLYTTGTGWPLIDNPGPVEGADFLAVHRIGHRRVRGSEAWFGRDYLSSIEGVDVPVVVHELGQWCTYPDFDVIDKFNGYLQPGNYQIFRELMKEAGLLHLNDEFARASGKFQAACYKQEVEANLRTPGLSGFQLLDLHDFLGQGTAIVGLLDPFWEEKGYINAENWRRFCNTTVPLAVMKKRVFKTSQNLRADMQLSHYGNKPLEDAEIYWQIENEAGDIVKNGKWQRDAIGNQSAIQIGKINVSLHNFTAPEHYKLTAGVRGTDFENDWDFWVYPKDQKASPDGEVLIKRRFEDAREALANGKKVLYMPLTTELAWDCPPIGRKPIFWNRLMGPNWERFLGILSRPEHPALKDFPSDEYYDWHWQGVFRPYCRAVNISAMPEIEPVVRVIDDWNRNYPLAAIFECRAGKGRLLVCSADLEENISERPAAAQLRKSLIDYMKSESFNPSAEVSMSQLETTYLDNNLMRKLKAKVRCPLSSGMTSAHKAIDGNPSTYWTTAKRRGGKKHPHPLSISFAKPVKMKGLVILNRQDHRERIGDIRDYQIHTSSNGKDWSLLKSGSLESTFDPQKIKFSEPIKTQHLKITALSGFGRDISASIAEISIIYTGEPLSGGEFEENGQYLNAGSATEEMFESIDLLQYSTNPTALKTSEVTADSESETDPAEYALDGSGGTFWHSQWRDEKPAQPHWIELEFKETLNISAIEYLPRQDHPNGRIKDYLIEVSRDGDKWLKAASGSFENSTSLQKVILPEPAKADFMRITAKSEVQNQPYSSIAEIRVIEKE
ncbi:Beta-glucuronidase [Sedimentisphaera salicampi]|nr:Beta-glucuronidase [Sedimentisphaera salicampi]